jgi:flagellar protein FliS
MNVAAQYRRNSIEGKSGVGLVVVLYDAFIASLYKGALAIKAADIEARTWHLNHAIRVVGHLRSTLDHKAGGEVAKNLDRYYAVTTAEILRACAVADISIIERLISQAASVADAWREADQKQR